MKPAITTLLTALYLCLLALYPTGVTRLTAATLILICVYQLTKHKDLIVQIIKRSF